MQDNLNIDKFYDKRSPGYVTRFNLPHLSQKERLVFVTFHLADSLPAGVAETKREMFASYAAEHKEKSKEALAAAFSALWHARIDTFLDTGYGSCLLRSPLARRVVEGNLHYNDGLRYALHSFVIMPNHVHVLFRLSGDNTVQDVVRSMKGFTGRELNKTFATSGPLWQHDYFDRLIRGEAHYNRVRAYIRNNPAALPTSDFSLWEK